MQAKWRCLICDPVTATVVLTAATTGMQMYSQYQEGVATSKMYKSQAEQSALSGQRALEIGQKNSELNQSAAKEQNKQIAEAGMKAGGAQRAALAAMGITGVTAENLSTDSLRNQQLDEMALRYNADVNSWQTMEEAKNKNWLAQNEAEQYRVAAKNAKSASYRNMFSTLLGSASQLAGSASFGPKATGGAANITAGSASPGYANSVSSWQKPNLNKYIGNRVSFR